MSKLEKCAPNKSTVRSMRGRTDRFASMGGHNIKRRLERRGGADPDAFDPKDLSGLTLWLKADSLSQESGTDVTAWTDQSGNGNDCTIPSATNRPHYVTNVAAFGGKPAISFTGANNEYLILSGMGSFFKIEDYTVFALVKQGSVSANQLIFGSYATTTWNSVGFGLANHFALGFYSSDDPIILGKHTTDDKLVAGSYLSLAQHMLLTARYKDSNTTQLLFVNGNKKDKQTDWVRGDGVVAGMDVPIIGAQVISGRGGDAYFNQWTGDLAELIVYDSALSERNLNLVHRYLADKYSLPGMSTPRL